MSDDKLTQTLAVRNGTYGRFTDNARVSQAIKRIIHEELRRRTAESGITFPDHFVEALDMIAHKISRMTCGDPYYTDTPLDIAGYAMLLVDPK
jgi:hypothetical protein